MERLPVLFKRMRDAREKLRNGTLSEEIATILVAVLIQHVEEAWHQIRLRHGAAWAVDALAGLTRLNKHMRDTVRAEHAALTHRLRVDDHGITRYPVPRFQPVGTLLELSSSLGHRCYSCATTNVPIMRKCFTLLRDDAMDSVNSEVSRNQGPAMSRPKLHRAHSSAAVDPAPPSRLALCCLGPILNPERDNQYYELLGVDRRCSQTDIKKAYRKISLEMHPDKRRQRGIPVTQEDRERFIKAKEAYEVLSDPKRRKVYDALGELGVQLTENPTSVDQNKVMRTMSHMSETTRCSILLIALAFVGFFGLYFPVLLSTNVQHTTDIPWGWVFLPVWVVDAFVLLNHLAFVGEGCSGSDEGGAPSDPEDPMEEDDEEHVGDDIPVSARVFHLVVFLLLVIFQILLVWMISTPSEDRDNWGGVFAPLFLSEALRLCVLVPGACTSIPAIDLGDTSDTSDEANFEREVQMMRAAQNRAIRSMHRRAIFGLLFRVLQEILIVVKLMGASMSWYEVFVPIWVYCGSQLLGGCGYCALSNTIQATITPPPEGATDQSWMTPEDRVKAQAAQEASAAGTAACCSFICVFVVAILVAVKAQDYSSFHAIIIFIPLLVCLCLCYCCTCLFICTFRELPEEEPGSSYEAPAAPPVVPASPTPSPIIPQAAPPAPAPVVVPPPAPAVTKEPEKMVSLD